MLRKFFFSFGIVALSLASAATYKVTLTQPSQINGKALTAGDYRLNVDGTKVTLGSGKDAQEVPAKVENGDAKYRATSVRYIVENGKSTISEIRLGGTNTKVVFQ